MADSSQHIRIFTITQWLFIGVGLIVFIVGAVFTARTYIFLQNAQAIVATVIDNESREQRYTDSNDRTRYRTVYRPTFEFTAADGKRYETVIGHWSTEYGYANGAQVEILYSRENPYEIRVAGFLSTWGMGLLLLAMGVVAVLMGLACGRAKTVLRKQIAARGAEQPG